MEHLRWNRGGCLGLWDFLQKFECLVNTWAVVGCIDFIWKRASGDEVVTHTHYSEAQASRRAFLSTAPELLAKFTELIILKYFQKVYQESIAKGPSNLCDLVTRPRLGGHSRQSYSPRLIFGNRENAYSRDQAAAGLPARAVVTNPKTHQPGAPESILLRGAGLSPLLLHPRPRMCIMYGADFEIAPASAAICRNYNHTGCIRKKCRFMHSCDLLIGSRPCGRCCRREI